MSERDPGLQPERTALAWRRTALSAAVTAAVLLRAGLFGASLPGLLAGFGALGLTVVAGWAGLFPRPAVAPRVLLAITVATSVTGLFAAGHLLWS
ncbi:DUF202 domain-containing protein [Amycolatopsis sp. RTGN1]|uniref:DUF202 domain-containing protein n=1 Tax=Amycolatopsis ponsaeliensis TaxID=2992142 RepID=UPI00254D3177|nr:DUF202 domain-containing protein [Amycolatopsis sp. RTGN1]